MTSCLLYFAAFKLVLVLLGISSVHANNSLSHLAISGWYTECDVNADTFDNACIGEYAPSNEPAVLDASGNTCYVNPVLSTSADWNIVVWFGPYAGDGTASSDASPHIFTLELIGNNTVEMFLPRNCSLDGACSCEQVDPLRGEDWRESGSCVGGCSILPIDRVVEAAGQDCGVCLVSTPPSNGSTALSTAGSCAILGTVIDTTSTSGADMAKTWFSSVKVLMIVVVFTAICFL